MSGETPGNGLDATLREFATDQKLFSRYRLIKTLGRGGMGIVWLARDEELERDVALKFLPDLIIRDRAVLSDLKRETRRSLELTHKNIVRIYDFVYDQTSGCISMEYVDGDTLSNLRADRPHKVFEAHELKDWVSQLCDALDYAHSHARIVHRDLKPANLMVNQRGDLKVADFGIARSLSDSVSKLTMEHGKSGTLVYMSPQQLEGERGTHLDDVYSLGASLYELLTSKPPFYSGNVDRQIREKIPPPMTQRRKELEIEGEPIDAAWEEVVRACLAKNPDRRPQSISEVAKMLSVPSPKTRKEKHAARAEGGLKKWIGVVSAVAVLVVLGISGWFLFQNIQKSPAVRSTSAQQPLAPAASSVAPSVAPAAQSATTNVAPPLGGFSIRTLPSGATIALNGGERRLSPATWVGLIPGRYPIQIELSDYEPIEQYVDVKGNQSTDLGTIVLKQSKPAEPAGATQDSKVIPNAIYTGLIHVKGDNAAKTTPLSIKPASDLKSGTMAQTSRKGDLIVKYTGVWEGTVLHAVTNELVYEPSGVAWEPEAFALRFSDDGKKATYECNADGKTYVADLTAQSFDSPVATKLSSVYKGTIVGGTPLTIAFGPDRKSGTMTQSSKSGDVVVKFAGIWDGSILRAVTNEVVSKPAKVKWDPESFTLRFSEDARNGSYECNADGKYYTAQLSPP